MSSISPRLDKANNGRQGSKNLVPHEIPHQLSAYISNWANVNTAKMDQVSMDNFFVTFFLENKDRKARTTMGL
jgi:hypothetical protein